MIIDNIWQLRTRHLCKQKNFPNSWIRFPLMDTHIELKLMWIFWCAELSFIHSQLVIWFTFYLSLIYHRLVWTTAPFNGFKRQQLLKTLCPPFLSRWHFIFFTSTSGQMVLSCIGAGCWCCTLMGVVHLIAKITSFSFWANDKRCLLGFLCV